MLALVDMLEDLLDIIDQHNTLYLDPNAENASSDRAGKLLNGIYFELVLPSGVNAYLQSPFGSGKNLLVFFDNDGVRGCLHLYTEILMLRLLWLIFLCAQLRMF